MTVAGLAIITGSALSAPPVDWDSFAIWGFKAKVLAHEALRPTPVYFHDLNLSYSHLDYPLMVPFLTAGAYAAMGTVDDQTGKLVSVFLDVLLVPLVYVGLRWKLRRLPAACLAAIPALLPAMFRYAGAGCADLPLTMFYAGSVFYVARWIDRQQREDLILAILFSVFAAFTKNEGLILALINGAVLLGFGLWCGPRRAWLGALAFFAGLLAVDAAWLIWSRGLPRTHEDYGSKLLSPLVVASLPKLKQVIPAMMLKITELRTWGLLWLLTGVMALLGWRAFARRYIQAMWVLLGLHLLVYALVYCVTPVEHWRTVGHYLGPAAVAHNSGSHLSDRLALGGDRNAFPRRGGSVKHNDVRSIADTARRIRELTIDNTIWFLGHKKGRKSAKLPLRTAFLSWYASRWVLLVYGNKNSKLLPRILVFEVSFLLSRSPSGAGRGSGIGSEFGDNFGDGQLRSINGPDGRSGTQ